jgi:hypothetical protein
MVCECWDRKPRAKPMVGIRIPTLDPRSANRLRQLRIVQLGNESYYVPLLPKIVGRERGLAWGV